MKAMLVKNLIISGFLKTKPKIIAFAGILGFISDILTPVAPLSSYIFFLSALLTVSLFFIKIILKVTNATLNSVLSFVFSTMIVSGSLFYFQAHGNQKGVFADLIPQIEELQIQLLDLKITTEAGFEGINAKLKVVGTDIDTISDEINTLRRSGGIIKNPETYAEYYHNAQILQERGDADTAMQIYEDILKQEVNFVDAIIDLIKLAEIKYGKKLAAEYLQTSIIPHVNYQKKFFIEYFYLWDQMQRESISLENLDDIPLLNLAVAISYYQAYGDGASARKDILRKHAYQLANKKDTKFDYKKYFINDLRGFSLLDHFWWEIVQNADPNRAGWAKNFYIGITRSSLRFLDNNRVYLTIFEKIDFSKTPKVCSISKQDEEICFVLDRKSSISHIYESEMFDPASIQETCNMSVRYFSKSGVYTETPLILEFETFAPKKYTDCNKYIIKY